MYFVYVIRSTRREWYYHGLSRNVLVRISQHNEGKVRSTRLHRPFELVYIEGPLPLHEAREREKYLKTAAGRRFMKKTLKLR